PEMAGAGGALGFRRLARLRTWRGASTLCFHFSASRRNGFESAWRGDVRDGRGDDQGPSVGGAGSRTCGAARGRVRTRMDSPAFPRGILRPSAQHLPALRSRARDARGAVSTGSICCAIFAPKERVAARGNPPLRTLSGTIHTPGSDRLSGSDSGGWPV